MGAACSGGLVTSSRTGGRAEALRCPERARSDVARRRCALLRDVAGFRVSGLTPGGPAGVDGNNVTRRVGDG